MIFQKITLQVEVKSQFTKNEKILKHQV